MRFWEFGQHTLPRDEFAVANLFFAAACREASVHTNLSACSYEFYSVLCALPSRSSLYLRYSGGLE